MKKLAVLLSLTIVLSLICFPLAINADEYSELHSQNDFYSDIEMIRAHYNGKLKKSVLDETLGYISLDEGIQELHQENPQEAIELICDSLDISCKIMRSQENCVQLYGGSYPNYSTTITPVKQAKTYWCGPASGVQAMIGAGILTQNASTSSYVSAQNAMATLMNTTTNGTNVADLRTGLNKFLTSNSSTTHTYSIVWPSQEMSVYTLATEYIGESLLYDRPCIIQTTLNRLPYYNGTSTSGHYITIEKINGSTGQTTVVDPHYNDAYFGRHVVTFSQLKTMIQGKALFLYDN